MEENGMLTPSSHGLSADAARRSEAMTCTLPSTEPKVDVVAMIKAMDDALAEPMLIGELMGFPVYVRRKAGLITIGKNSTGNLSFRYDHPYLRGTRIAEVAKQFVELDEPRGLSAAEKP